MKYFDIDNSLFLIETIIEMISILNKLELEQQYSSGKRQFTSTQLTDADLKNIFLSRTNLSQVNLDRASLKNADLSDANLLAASLVAADLHYAHLSRINLSDANLEQADFSKSILTRANLSQARLEKACFTSAVLNEADLRNTSLLGAKLLDVDLSTVNLEGAVYDRDTCFPADFDPISKGMINQCGIEDLLEQINHIYQCGKKYLGGIMTAKKLHSSRPDFDWLKQFTIDSKGKVTFQGNPAELVTPQQQQLFQNWLDSLIKSCSVIIKDFNKFL